MNIIKTIIFLVILVLFISCGKKESNNINRLIYSHIYAKDINIHIWSMSSITSISNDDCTGFPKKHIITGNRTINYKNGCVLKIVDGVIYFNGNIIKGQYTNLYIDDNDYKVNTFIRDNWK